MPQPQLRLALPRPDGSLLLDFEDDGVRLLDADTVSVFGLRHAGLFAHADAMTADGVCQADGNRVAASLLHMASEPAHEIHARQIALHLVQRRTSGEGGGPPRALDVIFHPFERGASLRIDDVIGAGMMADGYGVQLALEDVPGDALVVSLLRDADADWLLDAVAVSHDEGESGRVRAVLRAAWAKGLNALAFDEPVDPATLTHVPAGIETTADTESTSTGEGWWAPPDGQECWFETSHLDYELLAADIATIALRMHANREADGVPDATDILLLPFGSNFKLRMIWFDPEEAEPLGAEEYVLVLHVDHDEEPNFDAQDFEHLCRDAGQCVGETESYTGPQLYFRWEWGGAHWPLG